MRKREERRSRIEAAFADLRSSVATALGAAENEVARVRSEVARQEFALRIAQRGVAAAERAPSDIEGTPSPEFDAALAEALQARERIYADWTEDGPTRLARLVESAAPGAAGRPWEDWLGELGSAGSSDPAPGLWRIGTATVPDSPSPRPFPVAVPLLDESHLVITSVGHGSGGTPDTARRDVTEALVQNILLRVLGHFQPGLVRIHVWDVAQLTGTLPGLYPLTRAGLLTAHDPTRIEEMLDELSDHIRRIHTGALLGGHTSLRSLAEESGHRTEPWRIAVIFGAGEPLRDEHQRQLQRIARNGLDCGIQLIVVDQPLTVNTAVESITVLESGRARSSMTGPYAEIRLDEPPSRQRVTQACSAIAEAFLARRARVRTFDDLVPERLWTHQSTSGLKTPVGFHEGEQVWVMLGDASPHMLIGGPSGSGKTNFLYTMLGGLCARYSPDELELYLLDFKEGVSFAQFTPGRRDPTWLPHAQLVGVNVNADREFGLALLRFLSAEMRRRADAAKHHEVTKLEELRGEDPQGRWPRIVAVIDEFQFLFAERDAVSAQAAALLEDVARRGRSQGIHLVLASQDVSGIEAFWGKPAIFEQFIVRVALPKARRVLDDKANHAAMELPRWHAVVNHESGVRHGNRRARIPDATARNTLDSLQRRLWQRRLDDARPPRLFDGALLPDLSTMEDYGRLAPDDSGAPPKALLGQVIDVAGSAATVRLTRSPGRNIAVIGSSAADPTSVLGAAALSLARQHKPGNIRFTVARLADEAAEHADAIVTSLRVSGHEVTDVGPADIESELTALCALLDHRPTTSDAAPMPHCLLLYVADAAHPALERKDPHTRLSGNDQLRKILKQGPERRVHTIGWWRSAQRLRNTIGMGPVDDIGAWVAFDAQGQDLQAFAAGQVVTWSPRERRGLFFDRSTHSRPEVVLPFDATDALDTTAHPPDHDGLGPDAPAQEGSP